MNIFLALLPIALMVQVSLAASAGRVKRSDIVEEAGKDIMTLGRQITTVAEKLSNELINGLPNTEEYSKLKVDLEAYLKDVNEYKNQPGNCILKTMKVLDSLSTLYSKYEDSDEDSSEEMKELEEISKKHGGDQLKKDIVDFRTKYNTEEFVKKLDTIGKEETDKWTITTEVC